MKRVLEKLDAADGDDRRRAEAVGMTLISTVGGATGPLYGTLFLRMGAHGRRARTRPRRLRRRR